METTSQINNKDKEVVSPLASTTNSTFLQFAAVEKLLAELKPDEKQPYYGGIAQNAYRGEKMELRREQAKEENERRAAALPVVKALAESTLTLVKEFSATGTITEPRPDMLYALEWELKYAINTHPNSKSGNRKPNVVKAVWKAFGIDEAPAK